MRFAHSPITDWKTLARELAVTFIGVVLALAPSELPASVAAESSAALATVDLIRAFRAPKPPPADSIAQWLFAAENFDSYVPPVGTARALLSTGDINLIHSDTVRAIVVAMVSGAEDMASRTHDYRLKWQAQAEDLERYTDFIALSARTRGSVATDLAARSDPMFELPPGPRHEPFPPTDYAALLRNRDVYRTLVRMNTAHKNTLNILRRVLAALREIRPVLVQQN